MHLSELPANDASYAVAQVTATPDAQALIDQIRHDHGEVLLYQSDGCCDAGAPVCFLKAEYPLSQGDRLLGILGGVPFYMANAQFEFFKRMQLCVDAVVGSGDSFSLEGAYGRAFVARSRLYTQDEWAWLLAHKRVTDD